MRQSIGIAVLTVIAVAGLWAWTVTHGGANAQRRALLQGINTLELTVSAPAMPTQYFDAF
jgi:hypothetical protein